MEEIEDDFTISLDRAILKVNKLPHSDSRAVFSNIKVKRINYGHGGLIPNNIYHISDIRDIRESSVDVLIKENCSGTYSFDANNFLMRKEDLDRIIDYLTSQNLNLILDNVW